MNEQTNNDGQSEQEIVDDGSSVSDADRNAEEKPKYVDLPEGVELDSDQATRLARHRPTTVILLAGDVGSGKTTILGTTFDLFHAGPVGNYSFAGSESLVSFEDRCYLARIESGPHDPTVERTPLTAGSKFLHVDVTESGSSRTKGILFCDMSGEYYRLARDSAEECRKLVVLQRADHVAILVNGDELADMDTRQKCLSNARQLIRRFLDQKMIGRHTNLDIVVTKFDLVRQSADAETAISQLNDFAAAVRRRYQEKLGSIEEFNTAACPKEELELGVGFGLESLLTRWFDSRGRSKVEPIDLSRGQGLATREMDRFRAV